MEYLILILMTEKIVCGHNVATYEILLRFLRLEYLQSFVCCHLT
jgi:hypothetical protein